MFPSLASKRKSDESFSKLNVPEFNGKRWYLFKAKFLALLRLKGLDGVVLNQKSKQSNTNQNAVVVASIENEEKVEDEEEKEEKEEKEERPVRRSQRRRNGAEVEDEKENEHDDDDEEGEHAAADENDEEAAPGAESEFDRVIKEETRINKVGYLLLRALSDEVLPKVIEYQNDPQKMWNKLVATYESATVANRVALREQLHGCTLKKDEKIDDYVARLTQIRLVLIDINEPPRNRI